MSVAVSRNVVRTHGGGWDLAFGGLLFVVMTQLYRPLAVLLALDDLTLVTGAITALSLLYLMLGRARHIISVHDFPLLALALIGLPLISLLWAYEKDWRSLLLHVHYLLLMLAAAKCFRARGADDRLVIAALVVSMFAMVISIFWPAVFAPMAAMADARYDYHGRGSGLFLQPNLIAHNLILMMVLFWLVCRRSNAIFLLMALAFWVALFLTGSRSGLIAGTLFLVGLVVVERKLSDTRFLIVALAAGLAALGGWALWDLLRLGGGIDVSLYIARMTSVFSGEVAYDGSVTQRLAFQEAFLHRIMEKPYLGYGLGSVTTLLSQGRLLGAAHNQFLDLALQYGALGFGLMVVFAVRLFQRIRDIPPTRSTGRAFLVLATLALSMMGTNMVFDMQNLYILLGVAFAVRGGTVQPVLPRFTFGDASAQPGFAGNRFRGLSPVASRRQAGGSIRHRQV